MTQQEAIAKARIAFIEHQTDLRLANEDHRAVAVARENKNEESFLYMRAIVRYDMDHPRVSREGGMWYVWFPYILSPDVISSPDSALMLVDDVTGDARIELQP